ncbi:thiamine pyrophosphokinase [uncultured Mucilaginibacter sp.]|uniref:thiamine pyrophosphokinase n=1 Tax=uncultured Mucilaginibacter sp. TaxID=797541 RepID=UPI0026200B99|nr:thiamine pyrophosphokinase [uncultured Mucilaginibacter sp.]
MSSHHIVREKQEPALLILDLTGFDEEHLGQLLEWSPTVLVNDDSAEKLQSLGIKFDVLLTENEPEFLQDNLRFVPIGINALQAGLQFLIEDQYPAVNIIADKRSISEFLIFTSQITLVIFSNNQKIYPVSSGFSKWKAAGEMIEILQIPSDFVQSGLEPISSNQFKTKTDGFFTLQFAQPFLFIAEEI